MDPVRRATVRASALAVLARTAPAQACTFLGIVILDDLGRAPADHAARSDRPARPRGPGRIPRAPSPRIASRERAIGWV
ncbi:hypothetical protein [Methylobacterium soli]|uniref:hypothetical protein n=1 Tax=Methylobacterium soli TaxID=553447 RepID=UPI0017869A8C|nr:hypothetical protein [Methylobacterium soli]GJE41475.1 hypothetical protein AEGHOMDF_0641 [Methylobacterium soli]